MIEETLKTDICFITNTILHTNLQANTHMYARCVKINLTDTESCVSRMLGNQVKKQHRY